MKLPVLTVAAVMLAVSAGHAAVIPVSITEFAFTPATVFIGVGDTVQWTNNGAFRHSSTSGVGGNWDSIWDSGLLNPAATYSFAYTVADSYPYYCKIHLGMTGLVIVSATGMEEGRRPLVQPGAAVSASPNPFSAGTSIRFEPEQSVEVLDLTGRLVRSLAAGEEAGYARWDGRDGRGKAVASGVYLARAYKDGFSSYTVLVKTE